MSISLAFLFAVLSHYLYLNSYYISRFLRRCACSSLCTIQTSFFRMRIHIISNFCPISLNTLLRSQLNQNTLIGSSHTQYTQSASACPCAFGNTPVVGMRGVGCGGVFSRARSSRERLVRRRRLLFLPSNSGDLAILSRKKAPPILLARGRSSSASENPPDRYSSSEVKSPAICWWYEAGAEGEVIERECKPGLAGDPTLKAPGFMALELASRDSAGGRSIKPFWKDVLFEAWWRIGRICSS